jgi:hypothetical protein
VALRRVVHAQVVADSPDHDLARVEAHSHAKSSPLSRRTSSASAPSSRARSSAAAQARSAWSSWAIGAPKSAMMPSPVYWLMVPS